jgi:hypothetical protein
MEVVEEATSVPALVLLARKVEGVAQRAGRV